VLDEIAFDRSNLSQGQAAALIATAESGFEVPPFSAWEERHFMRTICNLVSAAFLAAATIFVMCPKLLASDGPVSANTAPVVPEASPRMLLLDGDADEGDSMGFLLALNSPEVDVKAVTIVAGMTVTAQGLKNELQMASLADRCDIPIAAGAQKPMMQDLTTGEDHGKNGIGDIELPPSKCKADPHFGPDLIIELVHKYPHQITIVMTGPETNVALAVLKDRSIVPLVVRVVAMAGAIEGGGNANAVAETNVWEDPEAAQIVFKAGWPFTMVGTPMGYQASMKKSDLEEIAKTHGPVNDAVEAMLKFRYMSSVKYLKDPCASMDDEIAVAVAIDPTLAQTQDMLVEVETKGEFTRGETAANRSNSTWTVVRQGDHWVNPGTRDLLKPNVAVTLKVDGDRFRQLFISRIARK
jgi:inosine-uridine nucleoside N-ribohydrolase